MSHIAVVCPPTPGHMNPMAALGRALVDRGHRVTFFQIAEMRTRVEAEGLNFWPLVGTSDETRTVGESISEIGKRSGLSAALFTLGCGRRLALLMCESAPGAFRAAGVDLVLVDDDEPAGGTVAEFLNLPYVSIGLIPHHREPDMPPGFVSWPYTGKTTTRIRNQLTYAFSDVLLLPIHRALNGYRRKWGLPPVHHPADTLSRYAQISALIPELDYPRKVATPLLCYTGPSFDDRSPHVAFPYERLNGKPLIYASFGTIQTGLQECFVAVAEACVNIDAQLVISTGGATLTARLAGDPIVVSYAPQIELLSRCRLCITHAGVNTVMQALRFEVPLVAVPIAHDQPAIAARVKWTGAGESVSLDDLRRGRLAQAVQLVWAEPRYRERARHLSAAVKRAGGVARAADIVEGVLAGK